MSDLKEEMLAAALADGLITRSLTKSERLYLRASVVSMNKIYHIIRSNEEVDIEQITHHADMGYNTCLIFCRWLKAKGLIDSMPHQSLSSDGRIIRNLYFVGEE